jgi:excisionase family DNA binding protein
MTRRIPQIESYRRAHINGELDGYLPLTRLAHYSGLSVRTLRGYLADRVRPLPHYKVGGKILVSRADFDEWVRQFRVQATPLAVDALVNDVLDGLV